MNTILIHTRYIYIIWLKHKHALQTLSTFPQGRYFNIGSNVFNATEPINVSPRYASRIRILLRSWNTAAKKGDTWNSPEGVSQNLGLLVIQAVTFLGLSDLQWGDKNGHFESPRWYSFFSVKIIGNSQLENWKILGGGPTHFEGQPNRIWRKSGEQGPDNEITEITMIHRMFATCNVVYWLVSQILSIKRMFGRKGWKGEGWPGPHLFHCFGPGMVIYLMINDLVYNVYNCTILNDDRMHSVRNMVAWPPFFTDDMQRMQKG